MDGAGDEVRVWRDLRSENYLRRDIEDKLGIFCHQKFRIAKFKLQKAFIKYE